jgi:hypothetical protein
MIIETAAGMMTKNQALRIYNGKIKLLGWFMLAQPVYVFRVSNNKSSNTYRRHTYYLVWESGDNIAASHTRTPPDWRRWLGPGQCDCSKAIERLKNAKLAANRKIYQHLAPVAPRP